MSGYNPQKDKKQKHFHGWYFNDMHTGLQKTTTNLGETLPSVSNGVKLF